MTNQPDSPKLHGVVASRETASPPSVTADGVSISQSASKPTNAQLLRAALYVDGFNLYHAIEALNQPHLKWLNLWALGERILPREKESLVKVRYFSAKNPNNFGKKQRHQEYINALCHYGVHVHLGHFISDVVDCRKCGHMWDQLKEKESDVGMALQLLDDAYQGGFEVAYLLTADSDHGATARILKARFPEKRLVSVVPPGMEASKAVMTHTSHKMKLPVEYLEDCLLPPILIQPINGKDTLCFRRPPSYAPPAGWVAPRQRRKN